MFLLLNIINNCNQRHLKLRRNDIHVTYTNQIQDQKSFRQGFSSTLKESQTTFHLFVKHSPSRRINKMNNLLHIIHRQAKLHVSRDIRGSIIPFWQIDKTIPYTHTHTRYDASFLVRTMVESRKIDTN